MSTTPTNARTSEPLFTPKLPIVTLFESYAAGAMRIGPAVAGELGIPWVGQQLSSDELESAENGHGPSGLSRIYQALARSHLGALAGYEDPTLGHAREQQRQVQDLTTDGAVILGRNATRILNGIPGVLHVKLDAPLEDRLERAVDTLSISPEVAAGRAAREDRVRAEMSLMFWGWDPRQSDYFDLILNTSTFGEDRCVEIIVSLARELAARATA